jgi:hypothetical protein
MIRPHVDDDVCDFIFKVFRNDENCLYVCIDCKSESEFKMFNSSDFENDNKNNDNHSKLNIELQPQYQQTKKSMEKIENFNVVNDICFIYLTTNEEITEITQYDNGGCLVVDRETTANFFGPAWSFYKTCRGSFTLKNKSK